MSIKDTKARAFEKLFEYAKEQRDNGDDELLNKMKYFFRQSSWESPMCILDGGRENKNKMENEDKDKMLFVSQPMLNKTMEEFHEVARDIKAEIEAETGESIILIDSWIYGNAGDQAKNSPVYYLGRSLEAMAEADYIAFASGWKGARGCLIERQIADSYDFERIFEF